MLRAGLIGVLLLVAQLVSAQAPADRGVPRTPWGTPDLNGVWDFRTFTPLQRPPDLAGKDTLTEEEALDFEQAFARGPGSGDLTTGPGRTAADFELWVDFGNQLTDRRTSLIVDPPDGRIPPRTADGEQRWAARPNSRSGTARGPEDLQINERCLWVNVPLTWSRRERPNVWFVEDCVQ